MAWSIRTTIAGVCLLLFSSLLHSEAEPLVQPADVQAAEEDNPMVCKRMTPTGSRIVRRYCLRESQWDAMRDSGQRAARDAITLENQYGYHGMGPGGPNPY